MLVWVAALMLTVQVAHSQNQSLYKDKAASAQIATAADFLYGYRLEQADSCLKRLAPKWGNHPGYLIFQGLIMYWRYMPVSLYPKEYARYKATMERAATTAEEMLAKDEDDPEATFFCMMAYSVLGRQASEDGESMKAVNYSRKAFSHLKKGFEMEKRYPEFYFSTGIFKYYRVRYPEDHPIYKPFVALFPDGNKAEGLASLEVAAEKGIYTRTEALTFLTLITLHYEEQPARGLGYAQQLVKHYPANPFFRILMSEALIMNGRADEVPQHAIYAGRFPSPLLKAGSSAMMGWHFEKNGDKEKARQYYQDALTRSEGIKKAADNSKSIALAGMARLSAGKGEFHRAKQYFRQVLDITNNTYLRDEAHRYIRRLDENGDKIPRKEMKKPKG